MQVKPLGLLAVPHAVTKLMNKVIKMKNKLFVLIFASLLLNGNAFASDHDESGVSEFCDTPYGQEFPECADHDNPEHHDYLNGVMVSIQKCQSDPHKCGIQVKVSTYDPHTGDLYIPRVEVKTGDGSTYFDANLSLYPEQDGYVFGVHEVHELDFDDYGFECVVSDILNDFGIDYEVDYCNEHDDDGHDDEQCDDYCDDQGDEHDDEQCDEHCDDEESHDQESDEEEYDEEDTEEGAEEEQAAK